MSGLYGERESSVLSDYKRKPHPVRTEPGDKETAAAAAAAAFDGEQIMVFKMLAVSSRFFFFIPP